MRQSLKEKKKLLCKYYLESETVVNKSFYFEMFCYTNLSAFKKRNKAKSIVFVFLFYKFVFMVIFEFLFRLTAVKKTSIRKKPFK